MDGTPGEDESSHRETEEQPEDRPVEEAEAIAGTPPEESEPFFARERFREVRREVVGRYHETEFHGSPVSRPRRVPEDAEEESGTPTEEHIDGGPGTSVEEVHTDEGPGTPVEMNGGVQIDGGPGTGVDMNIEGPNPDIGDSPGPLNGEERSGDGRVEGVDGYPDRNCPDSPVSRSRRVQDDRDDRDRSDSSVDLTPDPLNGQERSGGGGVEAVDGYPDRNCPDSPVEGQHRNTEHRGQNSVRIAGERYSVETLVDVERIKRTNRSESKAIMSSLDDSTKEGILSALLVASPRTYDELGEWTNKSKKTIKRRLSDLRESGVVEVEDGRPSTVAFRDDDIRLIASDVLSYS